MKQIVFSCEHGGNEIPTAYRHLFEGHEAVLRSHRGWDVGALELAKAIAKAFHLHLHFSTISRLLVELNRSLHHPALFSTFTADLSKEEKQRILKNYYFPYRNEIEGKIKQMIHERNGVLHLSIHSFTPILNKIERKCDVGLLYDPQRRGEKKFCLGWKAAISEIAPDLHIRFNYPYSGKADGFTTYLRKQFTENYIGIELEVNQSLFEESRKARTIDSIVDSLKGIVSNQ